jgi:succinate dehydrogenase / fumarate reductase, cytochrome b subunit
VTSFLAALRSSLGKKYVMGLTGLFLCLFLAIHLAGNFLLYVGEGAYNEYAHKLHSNPALLLAAEIPLYLAIAVHLYLAFSTARNNVDARGPAGYEQKHTKIYNRILGIQPESMMFFTGAVVFIFMAIHIYDFKSRDEQVYEPFEWAVMTLGNVTTKIIYVVGSLILGVHVSHGFRSAFQSLGLNHPKYNKLIDRTSIAFALIVAIGFASFPILLGPASEKQDAETPAADVGPEPQSLRREGEAPAEPHPVQRLPLKPALDRPLMSNSQSSVRVPDSTALT